MRFIAIHAIAIVAIFCLRVSATVINVPDDYGTIQGGIDASSNGDTVLVASGTYSGTGNINLATNGKAILVKGNSRAIIDGQLQGVYGFYLDDTGEDSTTVLEGFTIRNTEDGIRLYYSSPKLINLRLISSTSQGVYAEVTAAPIIENCAFIDNENGVEVEWGYEHSTILRNCSFLYNSTGVTIEEGAYLFNAKNCTFEGNITGVQCYNYWGSVCEFDSCDFVNNDWALRGGFILTNSYISDGVNGVSAQPGAYCYSVSDCIVENMSGTAFYASLDTSTVNNCIVRNNTGMVATLDREGRLRFDNCQIYSNAGGILSDLCWDPRLIMRGCLYYSNDNPIKIWAVEYGGIDMAGCTIYGNHCSGIDVYTYDGLGYPGLLIVNTIIASNDSCGIIYSYEGDPVYDISYCDLHDNGGGNYCDIPDLTGQDGNISFDPSFCDPDSANFWLAEDSPCVGTGQDGDDIGAYGVGCEATAIFEADIALPSKFTIWQNYPNPFNSFTVIPYDLPYQAHVRIDIYDILGRKVKTLVSKNQQAGYHRAVWNANDYSAGTYLYKLQVDGYTETRKMVLVK